MQSFAQSPPQRNMSEDFRPRSVEVNVGCMEVQTDESFLRGCKSAADVHSISKYEHRSIVEKHVRRRIGSQDDIREIMSDEEFTSDLVSFNILVHNFQFPSLGSGRRYTDKGRPCAKLHTESNCNSVQAKH